MKRAPSKKAVERRKRPRSATNAATARKAQQRLADRASASSPASSNSQSSQSSMPRPANAATMPSAAHSAGPQIAVEAEETCQNCGKTLVADDRALFVEEEMGRIFCAESCITAYFTPEIERLEKEYHRRLAREDLTQTERDSYAHLRWITLQEPDEIWREKTLSGDNRYTLISEFRPGANRIWCVCICLFLRGEPSFLYMAFTTRNVSMVGAYRRGERVEWAKEKRANSSKAGAESRAGVAADDSTGEEEDIPGNEQEPAALSDRLADEWTDDELFLAEVTQERREDDIPAEEFSTYEHCLEETLETPDEVWSCRPGKSTVKLYHFIRHYQPSPDDEKAQGYWYIIVAREVEDDEQIEVVDAFPTLDAALVDRYRRGEQEVGHTSPGPSSRVVH